MNSPRLAIEREAVRAAADGQHQHRRRAVDRVAGRHLRGGRAAGSRPHGGRRSRRACAQHREDRADRDVDVDVRRAVERVEHQQVLAAPVSRRNRQRLLDLLRRHRRHAAAPLVHVAAITSLASTSSRFCASPCALSAPCAAEVAAERAARGHLRDARSTAAATSSSSAASCALAASAPAQLLDQEASCSVGRPKCMASSRVVVGGVRRGQHARGADVGGA